MASCSGVFAFGGPLFFFSGFSGFDLEAGFLSGGVGVAEDDGVPKRFFVSNPLGIRLVGFDLKNF